MFGPAVGLPYLVDRQSGQQEALGIPQGEPVPRVRRLAISSETSRTTGIGKIAPLANRMREQTDS